MGGRKKRYNLYLEVELIESLEAKAREKEISTSEYIRNILNQDLNEEILSGADIEVKIEELVDKKVKKLIKIVQSNLEEQAKRFARGIK